MQISLAKETELGYSRGGILVEASSLVVHCLVFVKGNDIRARHPRKGKGSQEMAPGPAM
jgi:hypothetical protein